MIQPTGGSASGAPPPRRCGRSAAMPSRRAGPARLLTLAALFLAAAPAIQASRGKAFDDGKPTPSTGTDMDYCGRHCFCLMGTTPGDSYCGDCDFGYSPPPGRSRNCLNRCSPNCDECTHNGCIRCSEGFKKATYDTGVCVLDYRLLFNRPPRSVRISHTRSYATEEDSDDTISVGFAPLLVVACVVLSAAVRRVVRRALPRSPPQPLPTPVLLGVVGGEWETAPLVPQEARQEGRATLGNSVLVVGPEGNIEMGVADGADCAEEHEDVA